MEGCYVILMIKLRDNRMDPEGQILQIKEKNANLTCVCLISCCFLSDFCNPMNCSSSAHGILQARMLQWVAMLASRGSSQPRDQTHLHW